MRRRGQPGRGTHGRRGPLHLHGPRGHHASSRAASASPSTSPVQTSTTRPSRRRPTAVVHKGEFYIGLKPPGYVATAGEESQVDVLTVDPQSQPVPDVEVDLVVNQVEWHSVREQAEDGQFYWVDAAQEDAGRHPDGHDRCERHGSAQLDAADAGRVQGRGAARATARATRSAAGRTSGSAAATSSPGGRRTTTASSWSPTRTSTRSATRRRC